MIPESELKELEVFVDVESTNTLRPKLQKEAESFFDRYLSIDHPEILLKPPTDFQASPEGAKSIHPSKQETGFSGAKKPNLFVDPLSTNILSPIGERKEVEKEPKTGLFPQPQPTPPPPPSLPEISIESKVPLREQKRPLASFRCNICDARYSSKEMLQEHQAAAHHLDPTPPISTPNGTSKIAMRKEKDDR